MINEENLNKLYEGVIAKKELTTQELKSYGFNPSDLTKLVENKILERIKRGHYEFLDSYSLVKYGNGLIINKEYDKAEICFKKASILSPNYYLPRQQLFFIAIKKSDFPKALEYLEECFNFAERLKDNNFYLFFLNMITELPEKYRTYVKNLKPEEIVNLKNKQNEYYKIKLSICYKHFNLARIQLKEKILKNNQETFQDKIIFKLLSLAMDIREEQSQKIKEYLQKAEYEKIVEYLESLKNEYFPNDLDIRRLQLVKELINLRDNNELPKTNKVDTNDLYTAIDKKDYDLALLLARKNVEEHKGFFVPQELLMFLTKITEEIARINKTNIEEVKKPEERENILAEKVLEIPTFSTVISYLLNQKIEQATNSIKPYLKSIGKEQYEFLVLDLIKLSLINQDITFKEPILLLTSLISNEYTFDISKYVQYFYEKLSTNYFAEARIYLDILTKAGILGEPCTFAANLEIILDQSEKGFSTPKIKQEEMVLTDEPLGEVEDEILEEPDVSIELEEVEEINNKESITSLEIEEKETTPILEEKDEQVQSSVLRKTNQNNLEKETEQIRKWLEGQLPKLKKDGIILLEPMENEKSRIIYKIVKELPNVTCFNIGLVDKRMVLRYYTPEKIDNIGEMFRIAGEYYDSQEFTNALLYYRKLLRSLYRTTEGGIYSAIGFIYFYLKRKDLAIEYLTVASEMNKVTGLGRDYSDFISQLECDNEEDRKVYFKMDISEFAEEAILANVPYLEEITEMVMNGLSLEDAISKFDLTNEQKDIIILLFARSYFVQGNTLLGNKLLKKYEKSKAKTNVTKDFYQEVINNKNLYKNGIENDYISYLIRTRRK